MSLIQKNNIKNIVDLENFLIKVDHENIIANNGDIVYHEKFKYNHTFADGIYVREMTIDKDEVIIGAIHKHLHVWFLLSGHITVLTEDGISEYKAPSTVLSKPGIKRVIYGNERSVFTNVHKNPTNTKDIKKLEKEIVALSYEEYEKYVNEK
jgi:quercetin dioxygenase-like cupin family protein